MITAYASGTLSTTGSGTEDFLSSPNVQGKYKLSLDLNDMAAGDVIEVRAYKMVLTSGTQRVLYFTAYYGAQAATNLIVDPFDQIWNELTDANAVRFSIKQTFGTAGISIPWVVYKEDDSTILEAVEGIAATSGAALNADATTDNYSGGISGVTSGTTKVGTQTQTYTATSFDDGSRHTMTHSGNAIDIVYQFLTGGGTTPVSCTFNGYLTSANDTVTVAAWNHVGGAWETIGTLAGQAGSTDVTNTYVLYPRHSGTSVAELGKVYIRLYCSGMTSPVLNTDQLYVSYSVTSRSVGYANGAVWLDTNTGVAGTESFVNGTADNPSDTLANAITIATALALRKFEIGNGSSITLTAATTNKVFNGHEWTLALGGQNIASSMFIDATVSGTGTGSAAEFQECEIGNVTLAPCFLWNCSLGGTFTVGSAGDFHLYDCHSSVAGTSTPVLDMAAAGSTTVSFRRWSGGLTINNIASGDVISIDVVSGGIITLNGADGNVQIRGMCSSVVDNRTGSPTLGTNAVINQTLIATPTNITALGAGTITASSIADSAIDRATFAVDTGLRSVRSNTAQSATATTIVLDASASAVDDFYNNSVIYITGGTGVGQARSITDYVGSTVTATVATWATTPDNTSTFAIMADSASSGSSGGATAADVWSYSARTLTSGSNMTVVSPVASNGGATIFAGYDYYTADGTDLQWSSTEWPDLTSATIDVLQRNTTSFGFTCSVSGAGGTTQTAVVQIPRAITTTLATLEDSPNIPFRIIATLSNGHKVVLVKGIFHIA